MGGAYAFGELALLASIALPQVGVVTNVHPVHLERMGTIENIARTKAELVQSLPADGVAVLNGDDPRVLAMAEVTPGEVITYGLSPTNDIWASDVETEGLRGRPSNCTWPARRTISACRWSVDMRRTWRCRQLQSGTRSACTSRRCCRVSTIRPSRFGCLCWMGRTGR